MPIIESLLDTDLYKYTQQQVALHQFPTVDVTYEFKCRNEAEFTQVMLEDIQKEIDHYCTLQFTKSELDWLRSIRFFSKDYIDFLSLYKPNREHIQVYRHGFDLHVEVTGPWYLTIPFEVPVLAIINEVYFRYTPPDIPGGFDRMMYEGQVSLDNKRIVAKTQEIPFADFGTRRRYSRDWQHHVVKTLMSLPNFTGTSNVYLARHFGIRPIGTMAHEFMMVGQAREDVPVRNSQKAMLQAWVDEYRGDLGIALTDTVGIDAFLADFDLYFAKLYDGLRHDSGDPIEWGEKVIAHYESLNIDPKTKTLVFSDGLDMMLALEIYTRFKDRARVSFGIGTNLTNDFEGVTPLQIVMKLVEVNGRPVAKISDSPGKGMCKDSGYLDYLRTVFHIKDR